MKSYEIRCKFFETFEADKSHALEKVFKLQSVFSWVLLNKYCKTEM